MQKRIERSRTIELRSSIQSTVYLAGMEILVVVRKPNLGINVLDRMVTVGSTEVLVCTGIRGIVRINRTKTCLINPILGKLRSKRGIAVCIAERSKQNELTSEII